MIDALVAEPEPLTERPLGRRDAAPGVSRDHVLAHFPASRRDAPTLIVVGGVHGNEPAGIRAIERVTDRLRSDGTALAGGLLAVAGNLSALEARKRYLARDLNRSWTPERIAATRALPTTERNAEDREQLELLTLFEDLLASVDGPLFVLDLHTTSGHGVPFGNMTDTLYNRAFALAVPVPVIVGLEEELAGTMLDYLESRGFVTFGFEGGQHDAESSVDHAEAAIWIALASAGLLPPAARSHTRAAVRLLDSVTRELPRLLEVRYRHSITAADDFRMHPGFSNFQPVKRHQVLATDVRGEVRSPERGRMLMPLYQKLGDDGFFLVREFSAVWLHVSTLCRRLQLDRIVRLFPGVRGVPGHPESVDVDRRIARWYALELFHLLGYRRMRRSGNRVILSRRQDHPPRPGATRRPS